MPRPQTSRIVNPLAVELIPLDIPPLLDEHVGVPGIYLAACQQTGSDRAWRPVSVWMKDEYRDYEAVAEIPLPSYCGYFEDGEVFNGTVDDSVIETLTSVVATMPGPAQLVSQTTEQIDNGKNWIAAGSLLNGWEIIKVKTVTATAEPDELTFTELHRGQRSTDDMIATTAKSRFVVLDTARLFFLPLNRGQVGKTFTFKCGSDGADLATLPEFSVTLQGFTLKPFRPRNLAGLRAGDGELEASWDLQSRYLDPVLGNGMQADEGDLAGWYVRVLDGATVLREIDLGADVRSVTYTAAQQTADGITPGDPVTVEVAQVSKAFAAGKIASALL